MRLGIYGGSFDPVHYGHLLLAECAREQANLDELWFIPACAQPLKRDRVPTDGAQRVQMLELAIGGHEAFRVSTNELDRGGVSYTVDTLTAIHHQRPGDELLLLMGADALRDLPNWRDPARICELATLMVASRPGSVEPQLSKVVEQLQQSLGIDVRYLAIEMPQIDLSSRDIRRRVAADLSIRYRVPRAVEKLIETRGLYRPST